LTYKDKNYDVRFLHLRDEFGHPEGTECVIAIVDGDEVLDARKGISKVASVDQFNRQTGRRVSFERALQSFFPKLDETIFGDHHEAPTKEVLKAMLNKEARAHFWDLYYRKVEGIK
jgi:hypothetical protein